MKSRIDCERTWEALCAYSENPAGAECADVESHVRLCTRCSRDLRVLRHINASLLSSPSICPPPHLRERILAATVHSPRWPQWMMASISLGRNPAFGRFAVAGSVVCAAALGFFINVEQPRIAPGAESSRRPSLTIARLPIDRPTHVKAPLVSGLDFDDSFAESSTKVHTGVRASLAQSVPVVPALTEIPGAMTVVSASQRPVAADAGNIDSPEPERAAPNDPGASGERRIERELVDAPVAAERGREIGRVARAEERPSPPATAEVREMQAASSNSRETSYMMEAKGSMDPGAVASLADLRRTLQREPENEQPGGSFRMDDRREVRLSVHTSRF